MSWSPWWECRAEPDLDFALSVLPAPGQSRQGKQGARIKCFRCFNVVVCLLEGGEER